MNFPHLDLNLLRVLVAVYRTGSVTAAGRQLSLSQPATSNALARLRKFFGDELFVRSPSGLHPTRTAQRIAPAVIAQLQALESTVLSTETFDAQSSSAHWRLSLSDLGEILFLPALAQALRSPTTSTPASRPTCSGAGCASRSCCARTWQASRSAASAAASSTRTRSASRSRSVSRSPGT